ncbi:6-phospho-3-hexuloisomerase [Methanoculleus sp. FWC-SCC1]|uniref:6-phospho-3-hexuloisomerase n=1 Tax=Methanoculleus frigidifontis TaxID=2584085 RepID=A0ABT8M6K3_9EURY|nr:6-phospho-3-hexuloisomerase [Methanoculleus sp. FWC-SCC1]MDN7023540.1 6-phospho-3-hexuloisomerase [Methanoculleus sp. FWC-SCC1]
MTDHPVKDMMRLMATRIRTISDVMSDEEIDTLITEIQSADRVYTIGAGRSGLVAKAFAMRLMHLGLQSFVVGETVTPAMQEGDIIIAFSGSGETKTVADISETVKDIGGKVCLITSKRDSRIGRMADCVVIIESQRDKVADESAEFEIRQMMGEHKSFAPLGTIFETTAMVFADAIISRLMEIRQCDVEELRCRHANIE